MATRTSSATAGATPLAGVDVLPPGTTYIAKRGDTLLSIARRSAHRDDPRFPPKPAAIQAELERLQAANPIAANEGLSPGDPIAIPRPGVSPQQAVREETQRENAEADAIVARPKSLRPQQLAVLPSEPAKALTAVFGKAPVLCTKLDDGRIQFRMPGDAHDRFAFLAVTKTGPQMIEISENAFAVTADLVAMLDKYAQFRPSAINQQGHGLITETDLWDYFTFQVQKSQRATFQAIEFDLQKKYPDLMRFLADGQATGPNSRLPDLRSHDGGDIHAVVSDYLRAGARALKKPLASMTDLERFNIAAIVYGKLGVKYDDLSAQAGATDALTSQQTLVKTVEANRAASGLHSPLDIVRDRDMSAMCREQSYLLTLILRAAGLKATTAGGYAVHERGGRPAIASGHAEVAVTIAGKIHIVEPQSAEDALRSEGEVLQKKSLLDAMEDKSVLMEADNDKDALQGAFVEEADFLYDLAGADGKTPDEGKRLIQRGDERMELAKRLGASGVSSSRQYALIKLDPANKEKYLGEIVDRAEHYLASMQGVGMALNIEDSAPLMMEELEATVLLGRDPSPIVEKLKSIKGDIQYFYEPHIASPEQLTQALGSVRNVGIDLDLPARVDALADKHGLGGADLDRLAALVEAHQMPSSDDDRQALAELDLDKTANNDEDRLRVTGQLRSAADDDRRWRANATATINHSISSLKMHRASNGLISLKDGEALAKLAIDQDRTGLLPEIGRQCGQADPMAWAKQILADRADRPASDAPAPPPAAEAAARDAEATAAAVQKIITAVREGIHDPAASEALVTWLRTENRPLAPSIGAADRAALLADLKGVVKTLAGSLGHAAPREAEFTRDALGNLQGLFLGLAIGQQLNVDYLSETGLPSGDLPALRAARQKVAALLQQKTVPASTMAAWTAEESLSTANFKELLKEVAADLDKAITKAEGATSGPPKPGAS